MPDIDDMWDDEEDLAQFELAPKPVEKSVRVWSEVSYDARLWLDKLGGFTPTDRASEKELKGCLHCENGEDGRTYFDSSELRFIAAALVEAADWLDARAKGEQE